MPKKLLTVDDAIPKESPKELVNNQAKYNTRSKPKPEGERLVISDPDNVCLILITLVLNPFWIDLHCAYVQSSPIKLIILLLFRALFCLC